MEGGLRGGHVGSKDFRELEGGEAKARVADGVGAEDLAEVEGGDDIREDGVG